MQEQLIAPAYKRIRKPFKRKKYYKGSGLREEFRERLLSRASLSPFADLRKSLGLTQAEWAKAIGVISNTVSIFENLRVLPSVRLAKRMQEEARKLGLAVTLDELYQNVDPRDFDESDGGESTVVLAVNDDGDGDGYEIEEDEIDEDDE